MHKTSSFIKILKYFWVNEILIKKTNNDNNNDFHPFNKNENILIQIFIRSFMRFINEYRYKRLI